MPHHDDMKAPHEAAPERATLTSVSRARWTRMALWLPLALMTACAGALPNRAPVGEPFPSVEGRALSGEDWSIPKAFAGEPVLLVIGYTRRSQFDIDRWLLGLVQLDTPVRMVELPTAGGLFTRLFGDRLDESMRRGIPEEDWPSVITVYADASQVQGFLGTEKKNNARVVLLDEEGAVLWIADRGYSAGLVKALDTEVRRVVQRAGEGEAEPPDEDTEVQGR